MLHVANPEGRTAITKQPSRTWASSARTMGSLACTNPLPAAAAPWHACITGSHLFWQPEMLGLMPACGTPNSKGNN